MWVINDEGLAKLKGSLNECFRIDRILSGAILAIAGDNIVDVAWGSFINTVYRSVDNVVRGTAIGVTRHGVTNNSI